MGSNAVGMAAVWQYCYKSILWDILFLDQLHDFSSSPLNSFSHPVFKSKFMKKFLETEKKSFLKSDFYKSTYI